jgi:hypothetical protein
MNKRIRILCLLVAAVGVASLGISDTVFSGHGYPGMDRSIMGQYSFRLTPVVSFAPFYSTASRDSGVLTAPRQDILRVGTFWADGRGHVTGHMIATTDDGATTVVIDFAFSGTYSVKADGTGVLNIAPVDVDDTSCKPAQAPDACADFEGPETYAFVVNRHGDQKMLSLIQTDNEGGGAKIFLTGEALRR